MPTETDKHHLLHTHVWPLKSSGKQANDVKKGRLHEHLFPPSNFRAVRVCATAATTNEAEEERKGGAKKGQAKKN